MPTVIEKLSLDFLGNNFYIKRDDLFPFSFGGNKARKGLKFFEHILEGGYNAVATYGSGSSNHCRIVANLAAKYGMPCYIVSPEEDYHETNNSRMVSSFGAKIIMAPLDKISSTIDELMQSLSKEYKPYFILGGGHGNIGTSAYVEAYDEIKTFEKEHGITFDCIFHASGTGTTQAGLVCGAALCGDADRKIVGISIARANPRGAQVVEESIREYLDKEGFEGEIPELIFDDGYICGGYGKYDNAVVKTVREILIKDGIPLNTTYTGKAFRGMKEYIEKNEIRNKNILFIHTGGTPLFFDDLGEIL